MLDLSRRKFLTGLGLVGIAPLVIKTPGLLMPIKAPLFVPPDMRARSVRIVAVRHDPRKFFEGGVLFDPPQLPHPSPSPIPQREYKVAGLPMSDVHHRVNVPYSRKWSFEAPNFQVIESVEFTTHDMPMYHDPMFCGALIHVGAPCDRPGEYRVVSVEPVEDQA